MKNPEDWVRPEVQALDPYTAARHLHGKAGRLLLDANENAFGSSVPEIDPELHRYPDPHCGELRAGLARWLGVEPAALWIGNGSDEALDLLMRTFVDPGADVTISTPTYGMYAIAARAHGASVRESPLDEDFDLDVQTTLRSARNSRLIFLCTPNNPTGNCLSTPRILELAERHDGMVIVDEAYVEFSGEPSLAPRVREHRNLAVLRTFSKAWGLAGARVGYMIADPAVVERIDRINLPYPLNALSTAAACRALERIEAMQRTVRRIIEERTRLVQRLEALGFTTLPSDANFVLARIPEARRVYRRLAEDYGIIVRDRSALPRLEDGLRITVGRPEENDQLLAALEEICA